MAANTGLRNSAACDVVGTMMFQKVSRTRHLILEMHWIDTSSTEHSCASDYNVTFQLNTNLNGVTYAAMIVLTMTVNNFN